MGEVIGEKKIVVDNIFFTYTGVFDVQRLYEVVDDWAARNDYAREIKKKGVHIKMNYKQIECIVELQKKVTHVAIQVIRIRFLFDKVVEVEKRRGAASIVLQRGDCLVAVDGLLETDMEGKWHQQPEFSFIRGLFDKFVYNFHWNRHEKEVVHDAKDVLRNMRAHLAMYTL